MNLCRQRVCRLGATLGRISTGPFLEHAIQAFVDHVMRQALDNLLDPPFHFLLGLLSSKPLSCLLKDAEYR